LPYFFIEGQHAIPMLTLCIPRLQEKICEESTSFDLKAGELATAVEELTRLAEKFVEMISTETSVEDFGSPDGELPEKIIHVCLQ